LIFLGLAFITYRFVDPDGAADLLDNVKSFPSSIFGRDESDDSKETVLDIEAPEDNEETGSLDVDDSENVLPLVDNFDSDMDWEDVEEDDFFEDSLLDELLDDELNILTWQDDEDLELSSDWFLDQDDLEEDVESDIVETWDVVDDLSVDNNEDIDLDVDYNPRAEKRTTKEDSTVDEDVETGSTKKVILIEDVSNIESILTNLVN